MELIVVLAGVMLGVSFLVGALAVWRIGRVASWHTLAMTARATGSFAECVGLIRFCAEERSDHGAMRPIRHAARAPSLEGLRRAS